MGGRPGRPARVRRFGRRMAALLTLALAVAACSLPAPSSTGAGPDDLVWAVGGAAAAPGGTNDKVTKLYAEQDSSRPAVKLVRLPDAADLQREQMAYELQAQSSTFDILGLDVIWTGEFAVNGWIEKIEDRRGDLDGVVLDSALQSALHEGEVWAAPFNTNAGFLYYRSDLVDQPPKTWDELATMAKEIGDQEGIGGYVGQGFQYEGLVVNYLEYVWGAGGGLVNDQGTEATLTENDAGQKALEFMQTAMSDGVYAPGFNTMKEEEGRNVFQNGEAVFMRNWPYAYALMQGGDEENPTKIKGKFDIAPLPTFAGEGTVSSLGGFNLAVNAFSDKKEQAKDFIVWAATDPEAQKLMAEDSLPPVRQDVYDELQDDPVMKLLSEVLPQSKPRPPVPSYNFLSQEIQQAVFPAYNGDADPGETIQQLSNEINGELEG
jgi:multiple sugar transport system substrate-binding protein